MMKLTTIGAPPKPSAKPRKPSRILSSLENNESFLNKEQQNENAKNKTNLELLTYEDQSKKNGNDLTSYSPGYFDFNTTILPYTQFLIVLSTVLKNS
ncbi:hypothetical protein RhiirA4_492787 [Rhizophagus irregularis]|uniref:Uncharacterized protein n=1 Tax=Rhizophagus irregularis TaxID=588596 RepID=A0A2I1HXD1_9GLOM|nr:hypothetical protein RhiirA4_492787 [Rhizophagus irregularis]